MKCMRLLIVAVALQLTLGGASSVTPVQKVIQMIQGMLEKGKEEKHAEQVQFAAYKQFCDDTSVGKTTAIKDAEEAIEMHKADIAKYTEDAATLTKEIAEHDADVAAWTGDEKAATNVRKIEKADYDATHKDYSESVDALTRAVAVLKKQAHDRQQATSLTQVANLKSLSLIPKEAKRAIDAFLDQNDPDEGLAVSAPEANAYEFQSSGIVEMLEKLQDKFMDERTNLEKEEANSKHAYDMLMQDLKAQIEQGNADRTSKAGFKAKAQQDNADTKGELQDTSTTKHEDEKYLADLTATCQTKASDFESRQQLRAEEIEALEKCITILSGDTVSGAAEKHLPALLQHKKGAALAQLRSGDSNPTQQRVAQYLTDEGKRLNSRVLSALAVRVADDPFKKVKKMIKDLIVRLMESANEEAEHKGWCDTELSTNEQTRKEKTSAVEMLHAEIDELQASIATLTEDVSELSAAVAELTTAMATVTKLRQEEKAENTATIDDAQQAQTAVAQALVVLKEFYDKAAEATALVQKDHKEPEIFDKPYTGMGGDAGGVVGMLEVIQSDFARLEAETTASEASSQKDYDEFTTDSSVDKASKSKDIEHKEAKKAGS